MASGGPRRGGRGTVGGMKPAGFPYSEVTAQEELPVTAIEADAPVFKPPTEAEARQAALQLSFLRQQHESPYWTRLPAARASATELLRYTDRYRPERRSAVSATSFMQEVPLQKDVFPPQLWQAFTCHESRRQQRQAVSKSSARVAQIDWDHLHLEEKRTGDNEEEAPADSEEEDLGEYEDEVDDDYAQNYFDNGEDDDDMDGDGGDEAAFD